MKITNQKQSNGKKPNAGRNLINFLFILFLLILSLIIYRDSISDILAGIRQVKAQDILVSVLLSAVYYILEGVVIYYMAGLMVPAYPVRCGISTAFQCEFYRLITFGSGAGIAEIHYLHKDGVEAARGTALTILQYIMKKTGIMLLGIFSFTGLYRNEKTRIICQEYAVFLAAGCIITTAILFVLFSVAVSRAVVSWVLWILNKLEQKFPSFQSKLESLREQVIQLHQSGKELFHHKLGLLWILILNLVKMSVMYAIPVYLLYGKGQLTAAEGFMLMAVVYMLAGIIPAPSGVGSLEFVFLLFFGVFTDLSAAVPVILVFRFATWIFPAVIGGILMPVRHVRFSD